MRIGVDVGGTFTDIVLIDDRTGKIFYTKTLTTPKNFALGVMNGIQKSLELTNLNTKDLDYVVHGTTIGTNALIERKGAKTGIITTEGFRDILEIGRVQRPPEGLYDFSVDTPLPLVPRYLRREVNERIESGGEIIRELDEESVIREIKYLKKEGVSSIAVSLLFSFLNNIHEKRIMEICKNEFPEAYISLSSNICPEFREFERTSTTVINAYLQPILKDYISSLENELKKKQKGVDLRIMQANGGCMTAESAKDYAIHTVNSGPAGGALAGSFIGSLTGDKRLITVDMGGTSFDIGLVDNGIPRITSDGKFEGFPVKIPIIDVHAIGAGGGSIAWLDKGNVLNVGPMSAGADPGPACYNLGGSVPTVTDANLILNKLNPEYFLGGEMKLTHLIAEHAIKTHIANQMNLSVEEAALGIIKVINAKMVKGISVNSIEKGYDVRDFALVAFGGAGPLHAVQLASDLGMKRVIIPPFAGNLSALGLLVSDIRHDFVNTVFLSEKNLDIEKMIDVFKVLEEKGTAQLKSENIKDKDMEVLWSADIRFEGQSYELNTPVQRKSRFTKADIEQIIRTFNRMHERIYAYSSKEEKVEFVNLRVTVIGKAPKVKISKESKKGKDPTKAIKDKRPVFFEGKGYIKVPVYERDLLHHGNELRGPCIIEEKVSSTVLIPNSKAIVDGYGNIIITLR